MTYKREKPLFIDMDFNEALRRFAQTDKSEADELPERDKRKKKNREGQKPTRSSC
jgi:hypothetical protein